MYMDAMAILISLDLCTDFSFLELLADANVVLVLLVFVQRLNVRVPMNRGRRGGGSRRGARESEILRKEKWKGTQRIIIIIIND